MKAYSPVLLATQVLLGAAAREQPSPPQASQGQGEDAAANSSIRNGDASSSSPPEYLIVGAGGAGIQTALLLKKHGHTVKILERESAAGSFWTKFPVFQELISVNKRVRNETQRFRYDWHSFLESDVSMRDVSDDYFPTGADWSRYMNRVVEEAGIEVEYGAEVTGLSEDEPCVVLADGTTRCARRRVFVGTGLREKEEPYLRAIGGVRYSEMRKEMAVGKRVCIFGNGNAGYEIAQNIYDVADSVFVFGKRPARLSAVTKYTGDVRIKFMQVLENMHGKLLDSILTPGVMLRLARGLAPGLNRTQFREMYRVLTAAMSVNGYKCNLLVLATGFRSHVPGIDLGGRRFPETDDWYAAPGNPFVHYVGWLMHERDFQRGAGGFLSGYRYLVRNLVHHVREADHGVPYPRLEFASEEEVADHAVRRFQIASDLVVLQDGVAVRDVILPVADEGGARRFLYYEGVTYAFHKDDFDKHWEPPIYLYLRWGDGRTAATVFDHVYRYNKTPILRNIMLHPTIEVEGGLIRETVEDLDMAWKTEAFIPPIKRIVQDALSKDYTKFYPKANYTYERMEFSVPERITYEAGQPHATGFINKFKPVATEAVSLGGTPEALARLEAKAREFLPKLEFDASADAPALGLENAISRELGDLHCTSGGEVCDPSSSTCCNGKACTHIPEAGLSYCVAVASS